MIAVTDLQPSFLTSLPLRPSAGDAARALALAYLQWASACWRGDRLAAAFATRLGSYWCAGLPPMPTSSPDAISPHGGGGRGIH
jgi:hypothetical protein